MKNQILSEEFRKMQKLAGVITESQYVSIINEINTDLDAKYNNLTDEEKEDILVPYTDDGDIENFINLPLGELPADMQDAVKDYLTTPYQTTSPNSYTDDIFDLNSERDPYGDLDGDFEEDGVYESKLVKLKQFIKEEIQKMLNENVKKGYGLKPEEEKIVDDLFKDWKKDKSNDALKNIRNTEKYKSLSISATNKLNAMIRSAEKMES